MTVETVQPQCRDAIRTPGNTPSLCARSRADKQAGEMAEKDERGGGGSSSSSSLMPPGRQPRSKLTPDKIAYQPGTYQLALQSTIITPWHPPALIPVLSQRLCRSTYCIQYIPWEISHVGSEMCNMEKRFRSERAA